MNSIKTKLLLFLFILISISGWSQNFGIQIIPVLGGTGSSMIDYDDDGDLDVYVTMSNGNNVLLENVAGVLTPVATHPLVQQTSFDSQSSTWADYDNDGDMDVFIPTGGDVLSPLQSNQYFENIGGTYTAYTTGSLLNTPNKANSTGVIDHDLDGDVDILLSLRNSSNVLYENDGTGLFTTVSSQMGIPNQFATGTYWSDLDNDGDADVVQTHRNFQTLIYRNDGGGVFVDITPPNLFTNITHVESCDIKDYNNDLLPDILLGSRASGYYLFFNQGGFAFMDVTTTNLPAHTQTANGSASADVENDGDIDIFIAARTGPSRLWSNNGNGVFTVATSTVNENDEVIGATWGDLNGDGYLDLYTPVVGGTNKLYLNQSNNNNFSVSIEVEGLVSNKSGIGVQIKTLSHNGTTAFWQKREVQAVSHRQGQNPLIQHIGMGTNQLLDSLIIEWPSGLICRYHNLPGNQLYYFFEDCCPTVLLPSDYDFQSDSLTVTGIGTVSDYGYEWVIDQFQTNSTDTASFTFPSLGTYTVCLNYGDYCARDTICDTIDLCAPYYIWNLNAGFTADSNYVTLNAPNHLDSMYWDLGDGTLLFAADTFHTYALNGSYNICGYGFNGCSWDTVCGVVEVCGGIGPQYELIIAPTGETNEYTFYTTQSLDSLYWDLGNGTLRFDSAFTFTYFEPNTYTACGYGFDGCDWDSVCLEFVITLLPEVYIPNAFTPNGDLLNDEFIITGIPEDAPHYFAIFNRWGETIFETDNAVLNRWNGTYKNELIPSGSYPFIFRMENEPDIRGFIQLIR